MKNKLFNLVILICLSYVYSIYIHHKNAVLLSTSLNNSDVNIVHYSNKINGDSPHNITSEKLSEVVNKNVRKDSKYLQKKRHQLLLNRKKLRNNVIDLRIRVILRVNSTLVIFQSLSSCERHKHKKRELASVPSIPQEIGPLA